jgi:putative nucleotidyltransferase with HDIG domain
MARRAGRTQSEQELIHTAALLHDIGKFVFHDRILKANEPLTEEDWDIIRSHPAQGAQVISSVDGYDPVGEIILSHHERFDGNGYPRGLEGERIPVLARMLTIADSYDAMTARDSYRAPVSPEDAIDELRRCAGAQFDPFLVETMIEVLDGKDVAYRHGEDADFDAELSLEKHVRDWTAKVEREAELSALFGPASG